MKQQIAESLGTAASAASKAYPISVAVASFAGYSLQEWVYLTAIAVALCQLASMGWKFGVWLRSQRRHRPPSP